MTKPHALAGIAVALLVSTPLVHGQTHSGYRNFELGSTVSSVSVVAKANAADAKTIHERPALIQDLEWRVPYSSVESSSAGSDPVQQIVFSFYNDQLYKVVIDYDHFRTAGMSDADMMDAVAATYGTPQKPTPKTAATARLSEAENGASIARWGDADQAVVLYRSLDFFGSSTSRYWLIVTSPRLEALARTADAQAVRLDEREAPQREAAKQKKDAADARAADEKSRAANKAAFRP
jgi:hypothetical protein